MRLFWKLARQSFRLQLTYRAANLAGLATNFFFGLLRAAVLVALYDARPSVDGISLQAAITYTGLSQATIACLAFFRWEEVMNSVYSGDIASDLLKPIDYFFFWLAQYVQAVKCDSTFRNRSDLRQQYIFKGAGASLRSSILMAQPLEVTGDCRQCRRPLDDIHKGLATTLGLR